MLIILCFTNIRIGFVKLEELTKLQAKLAILWHKKCAKKVISQNIEKSICEFMLFRNKIQYMFLYLQYQKKWPIL